MPRDFRQIGALTKTVMPSPSSSASTGPLSTTSPLNPATTGVADQAARASNKTGLQPGASGFAGTSMTTAQDLGRLVAGDDPKATDKAVAASFPPSVTRSLRTDSTTLFGPRGADVQTSYILASPISAADRAAAISVLEAAYAPPRPEEVLKLLYRLKALTASREQHVEDMRAQAACYAEELMRYPRRCSALRTSDSARTLEVLADLERTGGAIGIARPAPSKNVKGAKKLAYVEVGCVGISRRLGATIPLMYP